MKITEDPRFPDFKKIIEVYRKYQAQCASIESITNFASQNSIDISAAEIQIVYEMLTLYHGD